jgi:UDP-4-amino-4,6-dideoxy-N-acetyl-beta-L-altrosamine transaminase
MKKKIPYSTQSINQDDIDAVEKVLRSELLTQGNVVPEFEKSVMNYTGAKHAVAVNSATSALHISCLALGLKEGDWLWTSPNTFVASSNCALYCGANIDFVDIDPNTWNMSVDELEKKLIVASKENKLPKIVIPVHLCGLSCDMQAIYKLSKKYKFKIIEDGSHAIGGYYKDSPVGNCKYSDITVFSFHPVKIITSGEGGMALTNDKNLAIKLSLLRSHGITRDTELMFNESHGPWYYEQVALGFNYRLTEIHAALGKSQMARLDSFVSKRNEIANKYDLFLKGLPVKSQRRPNNCYSSMHLYVIRLNLDEIEKSHLQVFNELREDLLVNLHYIPVHFQPWYQKLGFRKGDFIESEQFYYEAISIPCYPDLSNEKLDYVFEKIANVIK